MARGPERGPILDRGVDLEFGYLSFQSLELEPKRATWLITRRSYLAESRTTSGTKSRVSIHRLSINGVTAVPLRLSDVLGLAAMPALAE